MRRTLTAVAALIASVAMPVGATAAPAAAHHRRTTYTVTSTTSAGPTPHFPAFDPTTGHVVVSNVSANTVTDLDISTGPTRTFAAGTTPHTVVVDDATLHLAGADTLPTEATFDLVLTLDCLHDMTNPSETMAAIRRSIRPDGTWLVKDIRCASQAKDNLANPMAAMMYGFSIASCMSSALSEPDGAGLGTLGLHPELLAQLCAEAGFSRFQIHDFDEPANLYYEVRVG